MYALARRRKIETKDGVKYGAPDGAVFAFDPRIAGRPDMVTVTLEDAMRIEKKASDQRVAKHRRKMMEQMRANVEQSQSDLLLVGGDVLLDQMKDEDEPVDDTSLESMIDGGAEDDGTDDDEDGDDGSSRETETPSEPESDGLDNLNNPELRKIGREEFEYKFPRGTTNSAIVNWIREARKA